MTFNQRYTGLIERRNGFKAISIASLFLSYCLLVIGGYVSFNRHLLLKWLIALPTVGCVGSAYYSRKQWLEIDEELGIARAVIQSETEKAYRAEFSPAKELEIEAVPLMPILPKANHPLCEVGTALIQGLNNQFEIKVDWVDGVSGCTLNRLYLRPHPKVKLSSLQSIESDIQMILGLKNPPMIRSSSNGLCVDIEKPVSERQLVIWQEVIPPKPPTQKKGNDAGLYMAIGIDVLGNLITINLADPDTPHCLIAGATGGGKSEMILSVLASLINWYSPLEVELVLLDPKRTAFIPTPLKDSPYLSQEIVCEIEEGIEVLRRLESLMDSRYKLFANAGAVDIAAYNEIVRSDSSNSNSGKKSLECSLGNTLMPHIVCVIDELASYTLAPDKNTKKEAIRLLDALGRLARGAGIHLIAATQKPKADVIPSEITANFGARIALKTKTAKEGEIITGDFCPAHHLLGKGDALYEGIRLQAPWLKDRSPLANGIGIYQGNRKQLSSSSGSWKENISFQKEQDDSLPVASSRDKNKGLLPNNSIDHISSEPEPDSQTPMIPMIPTEIQDNSLENKKLRLNKYRELRESREAGLTKTQIIKDLWKLSNRDFQNGSLEYSALVREFGIEWLEDLLELTGSHGNQADIDTGATSSLTDCSDSGDSTWEEKFSSQNYLSHIEIFKLVYSPTKKKSKLKDEDRADFLNKLKILGVAPDSTIV